MVPALALLSIPAQIYAQDPTPYLTLQFFPSSNNNSCDVGGTNQAITFKTTSVPVIPHCFSLVDLFEGNATSGFVNQSANMALHGVEGEHGIRWSLSNSGAYDASANYSNVLYRQYFESANSKDQEPGSIAEKWATIYPSKDCTQKDPNDEKGLLPWYGFSCWSEEKGSCGTTPYEIQSFTIQAGDPESNRKCWVFAKEGQAGRLSTSVVIALLGTFVAVWSAL